MKRSRILIILALLVLLASSFAVPAVHWRLIGWLRGEAFYKGRPTSYWKEQLLRYDETIDCGVFSREPTFFAQIDEALGFHHGEKPRIMYRPAATDVLLELLKDSDPNIRWLAGYSINKRFDPGRVVPALCAVLSDEYLPNRSWAATTLAAYGPEARMAVPFLLTNLRADDTELSEVVAEALKKIDPEAAAKAGVK